MSGKLYTDEMKFYYFTSSKATQKFCTADGITDRYGWREAVTESKKGKRNAEEEKQEVKRLGRSKDQGCELIYVDESETENDEKTRKQGKLTCRQKEPFIIIQAKQEKRRRILCFDLIEICNFLMKIFTWRSCRSGRGRAPR